MGESKIHFPALTPNLRTFLRSAALVCSESTWQLLVVREAKLGVDGPIDRERQSGKIEKNSPFPFPSQTVSLSGWLLVHALPQHSDSTRS